MALTLSDLDLHMMYADITSGRQIATEQMQAIIDELTQNTESQDQQNNLLLLTIWQNYLHQTSLGTSTLAPSIHFFNVAVSIMVKHHNYFSVVNNI